MVEVIGRLVEIFDQAYNLRGSDAEYILRRAHRLPHVLDDVLEEKWRAG